MPGRKGKGYRRGFEIFSDDIRPDYGASSFIIIVKVES